MVQRRLAFSSLFLVVLAQCLAQVPPTSQGFKCTSDADCTAGGLTCLGGLCSASDAGAEPAVLRLAYYRTTYPFTFDTVAVHEYPTRGRYSSDAPTLRAHVQELLAAHVHGAALSWFGATTSSNSDVQRVFQVTDTLPLRWAISYEREPLDTPTAAEAANVLDDIRTGFAEKYPNYLRLDGGYVVFVAASRADAGGCSVAARWVGANRMRGSQAYLVLVTPDAPGAVAGCPDQPEAWRTESAAYYGETAWVSTVTPGVWPANQGRALQRDVAGFEQAVRRANDAGRAIQYVNSFNNWPFGTAIESGHALTADGGVGASWASDSGLGEFGDVLQRLPPPLTR